MATDERWKEVDDFEEYEVKTVELDAERSIWKVGLEHGFELTWPREKGLPQPVVGAKCRLFGDVQDPLGLSGVVVMRGDDGRVVYFRDDEEQAKWVAEQEEILFKHALERYHEREEELDERLQDLPEAFRSNIMEQSQEAEAAGFLNEFLAFDLEVAIAMAEHVVMLMFVIHDQPSLETFRLLPSKAKMGSVWNAMAEERLRTLERLVQENPGQGDLADELRRLTTFFERGFYIDHEQGVLDRIFETTRDLLPAEAS